MHFRFSQFLKTVKAIFFILCLPAIIWHAPLSAEQTTQPPTIDHTNFSPWDLLNYETLSYQRIIDLLYEVCYGSTLEKNLSESQLNQVTEFFIFLASNGIPESDLAAKEALEEDIKWLRGEPNHSQLALDDDDERSEEGGESHYFTWWSSLNDYNNLKITPAVFYGHQPPRIMNCGWLSKTWKNSKKFIKNHKKELIIATVVVVAATVVIIATSGTATPAVVTGIGGAACSSSERPKDNEDEKDHDKRETTPRPQIENISRELIFQQSETIKEELSHDPIIASNGLNITKKDQSSFLNKALDTAREKGSAIAHFSVDGIANTLEGLGQIGQAFQIDYQEKPDLNEFYKEDILPLADKIHIRIDQSFGTNYADQYGTYKTPSSPETMGDLLKELGKDVAFCFVPVPLSQLNKPAKIAKTAKKIVKTAKAASIIQGAAAGGAAVGSALTMPTIPSTNTPQIATESRVPVPREKGNIDVYQSINKSTGEVQYVGITNNLPRRAGEHLREKGIDIERIKGLTNLTKYDSKAVEQTLIEMHELEKNGGTLINRINSIAETNPKYHKSLIRGSEILQEAGYIE